ncbi:MAG TPA: hypothetical protein VG777_09015, partial [Thermoanaerobaculia bacterium]|nr:hypothetical protein [Thermoanaerobaculia bacterium]
MRLRLLGAPALATVLAVCGGAAFAAAPPPALTVDEIVAKNIQARGGEAKIKAIRTLRETGKASFSFGDNQIEAEA